MRSLFLHPRLLFLAIAISALSAAIALEAYKHDDQRCFSNVTNYYECFGPYGTGHPVK